MWSNPKETEDLFTFTEEILNGKLNFFSYATTDCHLTAREDTRFFYKQRQAEIGKKLSKS